MTFTLFWHIILLITSILPLGPFKELQDPKNQLFDKFI